MAYIRRFIPRKIASVAIFATVSMIFLTGLLSSQELFRKPKDNLSMNAAKKTAKLHAYLDKQLDELVSEMMRPHTVTTQITTSPIRDAAMEERHLKCDHLISLLQKAKASTSGTFRRENRDGNRGVYFAEIGNESYVKQPIVIKEASVQNASNAIERYRYNSALRELHNLHRLREVNFSGIPRLWGSCVQPSRVIYAVTRLTGSQPLCSGNGTDMSCAMAQDVIRVISTMKDPKLQSLRFLEKVTCFFAQFETHRIFMEDFSGANFHFSPSNWDLFLVDADSVIFYESAPLLSRLSCHTNKDCPKPSGNLWPAHALNRKIYYGCGEMYGVCINSTCQGIGSSLHSCGIGRWLITAIRSIVPVEIYNEYRKIRECTSQSNPTLRCSMQNACIRARSMVLEYNRLVKM